MRLQAIILAVALTIAVSASAYGAPNTAGSQFNINGFDRAVGASTIGAATGLDFTDGTGPTPGVAGHVTAYNGTGSFAGLVCNDTCGSIQDLLDFASFAGADNFYRTSAGVSSMQRARISEAPTGYASTGRGFRQWGKIRNAVTQPNPHTGGWR